MPEPRFRLSLAISLDGFIADARGGVDWLEPYHSEELGFGDFMAQIGSLVVGRTTYDQVLGFGSWPYDGKRAIVLTRRPFSPTTPDTEIWDGPVEEIADRLAAETTVGDIWILGGGAVARAFLAAGRVDTIEIAVIPVLLGEGIPLFGPGTLPASLKLLDTRSFSNGVVRLDYGPKA